MLPGQHARGIFLDHYSISFFFFLLFFEMDDGWIITKLKYSLNLQGISDNECSARIDIWGGIRASRLCGESGRVLKVKGCWRAICKSLHDHNTQQNPLRNANNIRLPPLSTILKCNTWAEQAQLKFSNFFLKIAHPSTVAPVDLKRPFTPTSDIG